MEKRAITSFEEAERYLNETPRFTRKHSPEDTKAFLHVLGDPDRGMRILHVAGTNGKGSVCAYLRAILEAAGCRVSVFTSPHLVDIRERFVTDGRMATREEFLEAFLAVYDRLEPGAAQGECYHPTYFEYLFFMAMLLFAKKRPDWVILESGLGGRLDATNTVTKKEAAVITRIGLDHVEYLGDTVTAIAGEKAGILQACAPAVYLDAGDGTAAVFDKRAAQLGCPSFPVSKNDYTILSFQDKSIDFLLRTLYYGNVRLTLSTIAAYQAENAALAVRALEAVDQGRTISLEAIRKGLACCRWPGRMEELLPGLWVDGAHNEDGIRGFLESVARDGWNGKRRLLFGVAADKAYTKMLERIVTSGLFDGLALVRLRTARSASCDLLKKQMEQYPECPCVWYGDVPSALRALLDGQKAEERIYAAGSLYLVGEIKELVNS